MDGFLLAYKEKGITSNKVVQQAKKLLSLKKVGHLGTLDPMAEGLLVLAVNRATRFSSFFLESDKSYEAEICFGIKTDTDDAMGKVVEESSLIPKESDIKKELNKFLGESLQNPPFFSALKHKGKPLYKYARDGEFISKPPRRVNIYSIKNFNYFNNRCSFLIHCSKGTYIRSIARDLGDNLASGGHLSALKRVKQGEFNIEQSKIPSELEMKKIISIESAFQFFKEIKLNEEETKVFSNGGKLAVENQQSDFFRIYDFSNKFLGLGVIVDSQLALKRLV
ncbi:MAG: tRNA pseudouridine(55) synthase TruB [SAR86 cluster bacterium]|nr:tRNA pseudouridine(55) synthase TruB [SAR86 cluster bacterium]